MGRGEGFSGPRAPHGVRNPRGGTTALRALVLEFLQEVLPHLIAEERAWLVFDTPDLGVLHLLRVEPHVLDAQRRDGRHVPDLSHGMERVSSTRASSNGGNHPGGRRRFRKRAARYRVWRNRQLRRTVPRASNRALMLVRWTNSPMKLAFVPSAPSSVTAIPVVFGPGSSLTRRFWRAEASWRRSTKRIVKGAIVRTRAVCARLSEHGMSGF